jgi:hypothetical protein
VVNGNKPICVLAGSQQQFDDWLRASGLQRREAVYCNSMEKIHGMEFSRIEKIGTWYAAPMAYRLAQEALTRVR